MRLLSVTNTLSSGMIGDTVPIRVPSGSDSNISYGPVRRYLQLGVERIQGYVFQGTNKWASNKC
jgi:hypothetical protein